MTSYLRRFIRKRATSRVAGLRSCEEFAAILELERQRSDRSKVGFSLLTFAVRSDPDAEATFKCVARILRRRLRTTDQVGRLEGNRLGVIFPGTPAAGAWIAADSICDQLPEKMPPPICDVLVYPSSEAPDQDQEAEAWSAEEPEASNERPAQAMEMLFVVQTPSWKRALDIAGSAIGLLVLAPLLALAAAAIKLTSRGPVIFSQMRSGHGGKQFRIYKLRSMVVDADERKQALMQLNEQDGPAFKVKNDPRITRVGKFLRSTSIDELPQLWNVLRGDMSLVGPRPLPCSETAGCNPWQRRRLAVPPGLTCIWQVTGRSKVSFDDWARMDIRYIRTRALVKDVKLILQTLPAVIFRRGAH